MTRAAYNRRIKGGKAGWEGDLLSYLNANPLASVAECRKATSVGWDAAFVEALRPAKVGPS
jgi:hypothetical protein